jgi:hypothetical protein
VLARKIVVITPMWRREELAKIMIRSLRRVIDGLSGSVDVVHLVCGSEGDKSRSIAMSCGAEYMEAQNQPLGAKFNAALQGAMSFNPDGVMVLGSDNFINADAFLMWDRFISEGVESMGFLDAYMIDPFRRKMVHWLGYNTSMRKGEPLGSGRCYSRSLLDRVNWRLWDSRKRESLDWSVTQRLKQFNPVTRVGTMDNYGIYHLGVKTKENIVSLDRFFKYTPDRIELVDASELEVWFGAETADEIFSISKGSTIQELRVITDPPNERETDSLRKRLKVELQDKVVCPRCMALVCRNDAISFGVRLCSGESFICRECARKEHRDETERRARGSGAVRDPSEILQRVPRDGECEGEGSGDDSSLLSGWDQAIEAAGGPEGESDDGGSADFPEDFLGVE